MSCPGRRLPHNLRAGTRPRVPLQALRVGQLQMLRNDLAPAKPAPSTVTGCPGVTLAGYYKELLSMIAALGIV